MILNSENLNIWWGYKPITEWALEGAWFGGNWKANDLGVSYDKYKTQVTFRGPESLLQDLETAVLTGAGRASTVSMTCSEGEEIFGAELDYTSPITVAVDSPTLPKRINKELYESKIKFILTSTPAFKSLTPSLSGLILNDIKYSAGQTYDVMLNETLLSAATFQDGEGDTGIFEAVYNQRQNDMADIRRYIMLTARNNTFNFPHSSIDYPFGYRAGTGPFTVKIVDWEDLGRSRYSEWKIRIKFAMVNS